MLKRGFDRTQMVKRSAQCHGYSEPHGLLPLRENNARHTRQWEEPDDLHQWGGALLMTGVSKRSGQLADIVRDKLGLTPRRVLPRRFPKQRV